MTQEQMYRILMVAFLIGIIVSLALLLTGCSGGMAYDTLKAKAADSGSPPQCVVVTDETSGFNNSSRIIGTYCRTTTTVAPR